MYYRVMPCECLGMVTPKLGQSDINTLTADLLPITKQKQKGLTSIFTNITCHDICDLHISKLYDVLKSNVK